MKPSHKYLIKASNKLVRKALIGEILQCDPRAVCLGAYSSDTVEAMLNDRTVLYLHYTDHICTHTFATIDQALEDHPNVPVLIITTDTCPQSLVAIVQRPVRGVVVLNESTNIAHAIQEVVEGRNYFGRTVTQAMAQVIRLPQQQNVHLTAIEEEVLRAIVNGMTTKEVANSLFRSARTIDAHRRRVMEKLHARNTADLVRMAITKGLVRVEMDEPMALTA